MYMHRRPQSTIFLYSYDRTVLFLFCSSFSAFVAMLRLLPFKKRNFAKRNGETALFAFKKPLLAKILVRNVIHTRKQMRSPLSEGAVIALVFALAEITTFERYLG